MAGLLTGRAAHVVYEYYKLLDCRSTGLDDLQFGAFLACSSDLSKHQIERLFDILDVDRSGSVEFDEVRMKPSANNI
jgi:Ca2+-binding EF-hand superfamily protein